MEKMRRREIEQNSNIALVDQNAQVLEKSVQELRKLRSQVYDAADYCETSFLNTPNKTIVVETTKDYISRAVAAVVDHLGGISANLEYSLRNTLSIPQTEHHIDMLRLRIGSWQQHSHKLALERFYMTADFSRHHCRYILPPSNDSEMKNVESRCTNGEVEANDEKGNEFETEEPLFLHTYNCKPSLQVDNSKMDMVKTNQLLPPVLPVHDRLAILPKAEQSTFQFQIKMMSTSMIATASLLVVKQFGSLPQRVSILLPHHVVERGPRGKGRWGWKPQAFLHLCSAKAKTPRRRGMGTV
ncbi:UNVERIFIED_CONTAM: hypothetical protein Sangu_1545800 [Sesamum angustifolium]|uniref:Uncharacterized protein n=1 Tax=Sesamum angustifolium TaxID=2727405 RepID=A0AAW2MV11_9LAMI